jgi:transposase
MKKYSEKDSVVESVYSIIKNRNCKVTTKYLEKEIGSKYKVHYAVTRLIKEGKIKRIRALGRERIEYFYEDI